MNDLTFVEHIINTGNFRGCSILAEYVYNPLNEENPFYDFALSLLGEFFEDYRKKYTETETFIDGICEIENARRMMLKTLASMAEKENRGYEEE